MSSMKGNISVFLVLALYFCDAEMKRKEILKMNHK